MRGYFPSRGRFSVRGLIARVSISEHRGGSSARSPVEGDGEALLIRLRLRRALRHSLGGGLRLRDRRVLCAGESALAQGSASGERWKRTLGRHVARCDGCEAAQDCLIPPCRRPMHGRRATTKKLQRVPRRRLRLFAQCGARLAWLIRKHSIVSRCCNARRRQGARSAQQGSQDWQAPGQRTAPQAARGERRVQRCSRRPPRSPLRLRSRSSRRCRPRS